MEDISCDSSRVRAGALTSGVVGIFALQAWQNRVVLGLMGFRENSRSLGFFLGEVLLWAERVRELIGRLWARVDREGLVLGGLVVVGTNWREVWMDLLATFGEFWRCFLTPVAGVGEVSRERLRLPAGVGEREFLVVGAIVAAPPRSVFGS